MSEHNGGSVLDMPGRKEGRNGSNGVSLNPDNHVADQPPLTIESLIRSGSTPPKYKSSELDTKCRFHLNPGPESLHIALKAASRERYFVGGQVYGAQILCRYCGRVGLYRLIDYPDVKECSFIFCTLQRRLADCTDAYISVTGSRYVDSLFRSYTPLLYKDMHIWLWDEEDRQVLAGFSMTTGLPGSLLGAFMAGAMSELPSDTFGVGIVERLKREYDVAVKCLGRTVAAGRAELETLK